MRVHVSWWILMTANDKPHMTHKRDITHTFTIAVMSQNTRIDATVSIALALMHLSHIDCMVTGHNGHKPKRPQTGTAIDRNGHKPKRPQTGTATDRNGHKPKRPQTGTATNRNGHRPERPQTETATSVVTHHISCHQNIYDGEFPIGNVDIHAKLHRNRPKGWNARTCDGIQVINWTDEANYRRFECKW